VKEAWISGRQSGCAPGTASSPGVCLPCHFSPIAWCETRPETRQGLLKHSVLDIAEDLLAEEGIGSHEKGYLYGVLMDHASKKLLEGKTVGAAPVEALRHALNRRHRLAANFKGMPGLVGSIVKYRKEGNYAR